jgi:hypothetical protein
MNISRNNEKILHEKFKEKINDKIYEIYNITEEEKKVIESV